MEELKLWENIKKGDVKSLQKLHETYFYQMCLFAQKTVHDNQWVENIVSDCFIKLWENRKKIEIESSIKSYLYRILRNQIVDHYRGKQEKAELLDELPDIPNETEFDEQQRYAKLYKAISKLPNSTSFECNGNEGVSCFEFATQLIIFFRMIFLQKKRRC